jgi:hypothetical protein
MSEPGTTKAVSTSPLTGADNHPLHTDSELVRRWLYAVNTRRAMRHGTPLWVKVSEEFGIGSTSAWDVCKRHGYDPNMMVRKRP